MDKRDYPKGQTNSAISQTSELRKKDITNLKRASAAYLASQKNTQALEYQTHAGLDKKAVSLGMKKEHKENCSDNQQNYKELDTEQARTNPKFTSKIGKF